MKCYSCGSSLVGETKIKKRANGSERIHAYYHCSRQVNRTCREPYATEKSIIEQLSGMCNELIIDSSMEPSLNKSINKFAAMMASVNPERDRKNTLAAYVKYVLCDGSAFEKTRLVRNLDVRLALHERKLIKI